MIGTNRGVGDMAYNLFRKRRFFYGDIYHGITKMYRILFLKLKTLPLFYLHCKETYLEEKKD